MRQRSAPVRGPAAARHQPSGSSTASPFRHLLAEHPHNRLWVTVNDGQQDASGAIWNTASLFPFFHGTRVEPLGMSID